MVTTKCAKRRETRRDVSSRFALGKMNETLITQAVLFFEYLVIFVVTLRDLFNEFFRPVSAPILLLFVVINNSVFTTCCKSSGCESEFSGITMKEQGITTLLFAQAAHGFSVWIFEKFCSVDAEQKKSMMAGSLRGLPSHGLFTGNSINYAIVSLLFPDINRKRFCNPLEINMSEDRILGREQEISGEASGRNREHFQGRFLKLCNHLAAVQATTLRRLSFVVQLSAMSCKNQSKSDQIRLNQTKSNHYFFRELCAGPDKFRIASGGKP